IELGSTKDNNKALFCLKQGGRVDHLTLNNESILADLPATMYHEHYASAILFPFANRVKNGIYEFNNNRYQLYCNEINKQNAIHGLVYNKNFDITTTELNEHHGIISLHYKYRGLEDGSPFKFHIQLTYILKKTSLELQVTIHNIGQQAFPFTIGWHPYFISSNLSNSYLEFKGLKKVGANESARSNSENASNSIEMINLKDTILDDAFYSEYQALKFITPNYDLLMKTSSKNNYIQLYTPEVINTIAIEPMTGVPNSFNNKIGLQTLNPSKSYTICWTISVQSKNNHQPPIK
ncbi:MAG: aldose 1-epimerase, partial [Winogradskyella sp.]|nr:aldose 1-epimerase [Winogradskyella sp.]